MSMGKMQEIANELKKKFPEVNKKGGFFTHHFYNLYGPNSRLDSLVNGDMNLADSDFLFYHSPHPGTRISFTDTYLYFSAGLPGSPSARIPIIKSISSFYAWKSPSFEDVYLPIFRIEIQKMIEINLTSIDMVSSSLKKYILNFSDLNENQGAITVQWTAKEERIYEALVHAINNTVCKYNLGNLAKSKEENLDYESAISIWEQMGDRQKAKEVRKKMIDSKASKTVVHGDYVDDRDTIVKDSVINKSNIGAGGKSKAEEIKEIKELLDSGAIDKDDYEKMKREIVG